LAVHNDVVDRLGLKGAESIRQVNVA